MAQTVNDMGSGSVTIDTPGTPEALGPSGRGNRLLIRAMSTNTGAVFIGQSDSPSFPVPAGELIELHSGNPASVYVDAEVAGEGVDWLAEMF